MTDLRARLAEGAQNLIAKHNDGYAPPCEQIEQVIAAVFSLPGIAIVDTEHLTPEWGIGDAGNKPIQTGDTEEHALAWAARRPHSPAWRRYVTPWERMT